MPKRNKVVPCRLQVEKVAFSDASSSRRKLLAGTVTFDMKVYDSDGSQTQAALDACAASSTCSLGGTTGACVEC